MKKAHLFLAVLIVLAFGANGFAACTTAFPTSAKKEFLDGVHLAANTYKIAYTLDTRASNSSGTTAWIDFADEVAAGVTFTSAAKCVIIYNDTVVGDPAIYVGNLASAVQPSAGTLTVTFPTADATNAIVRVQ